MAEIPVIAITRSAGRGDLLTDPANAIRRFALPELVFWWCVGGLIMTITLHTYLAFGFGISIARKPFD